MTALKWHDFCTIFAHSLYGFFLSVIESSYKIRMMVVYIHVYKPYLIATYNARKTVQKIVSSIKLSHGACSKCKPGIIGYLQTKHIRFLVLWD